MSIKVHNYLSEKASKRFLSTINQHDLSYDLATNMRYSDKVGGYGSTRHELGWECVLTEVTNVNDVDMSW